MTKKKIICMLLLSALIGAAAFSTSLNLPGTQETQARTSISEYQALIKQAEADKAAAEKEKKELQSQISDTKAVIAGLENSKSDLATYITELDAQYMTVVENIETLEALIEVKNGEIATAEQELADAIATAEAQYEAMKVRIQFFYERSDNFYLETLLTADSFGELLNRIEYMKQVLAYDQNMLDNYNANIEYVEACKAKLEAEKEVLDAAELRLNEERLAMEELIAAKQVEMEKYEAQIASSEAAKAAYEEELAEQAREIELFDEIIEEYQNALNSLRGFGEYDGSTFTWPCPAYTRISSDFGYRIHPIYKYRKFHSGVDMAAPYGAAILAAYNGQVVKTGYDKSMGNYVLIDHGSNLYTIYMHCSKVLVKAGDLVYAGDQIAKVGSTGSSTGNHLHFGVRLNGSYVSPWDYLPTGYK